MSHSNSCLAAAGIPEVAIRNRYVNQVVNELKGGDQQAIRHFVEFGQTVSRMDKFWLVREYSKMLSPQENQKLGYLEQAMAGAYEATLIQTMAGVEILVDHRRVGYAVTMNMARQMLAEQCPDCAITEKTPDGGSDETAAAHALLWAQAMVAVAACAELRLSSVSLLHADFDPKKVQVYEDESCVVCVPETESAQEALQLIEFMKLGMGLAGIEVVPLQQTA